MDVPFIWIVALIAGGISIAIALIFRYLALRKVVHVYAEVLQF